MNSTKLIAIYFPQFHNIPENDIWWGRNFTDWELVKNARPLFHGHYQPRVPVDVGYYNPCDKNTLRSQIDMAKKYNVYGFMFYHYWFDGKLILEKPLNTFLENPDLNMPFCLSWANGSWTRQWIGNNEFLLEQKHTQDPKLWKAHFNYLLPFFKDKRAICIDGKPMFCIYNPDFVKQCGEMFSYWNQLAIENGLKGIYYVAMKNYEFPEASFLSNYDALMKFQPREANTSSKNRHRQRIMSIKWMRALPESVQNKLNGIRLRLKSKTIIRSDYIWEHILYNAYMNDYTKANDKLKIFESAFFDWDNTARYKNKATIYTNLTMENKKNYLMALKQKAEENRCPYIFFNAWNEWSESAYLEPDSKNGYAHLEIIRDVFTSE